MTLYSIICSGQVILQGEVTDQSNAAPIVNVAVILYGHSSNEVVGYTYSDKNGQFKFKETLAEGIYKMVLTSMNYEKVIQEMVIGANKKDTVNISIQMAPREFNLKEVTVQRKDPIIIKKDTTIYNIDRLKSKHNESLEDVLAKIEGFKILPDGSIQVNGKTIQKVLVDGKEVSDFGSALLTKSLGAEKVNDVEVRFDEKNEKIKESLLSDQKFVVLDIHLKDNFDHSFFGKQQIRTGYQNHATIGGLTNLFSLNKKINIQFFGESDNFGRNKIKLSHIKNIGQEAFAQMLSLPVDFDEIKSRRGYQEELYGFDDYVKNDKSIAGIAVNIPLSKKTDLYFGSFDNYTFLNKKFSQDLWFENTFISHFEEGQYNREYNSKNKLQLKHTSNHLKISTGFNYVFTDQGRSELTKSPHENNFKENHYSKDFYINNRMEYLITDDFGLSETFNYSHEDYKIDAYLNTRNGSVLNYLELDSSKTFNQYNRNKQSIVNNNLTLTYKGNQFSNHSIGYGFRRHSLENEKLSNVNSFESSRRKYNVESHSIKYKGGYFLGNFYLNVKLDYSFVQYPVNADRRNKSSYFQYDLTGTYDFNNRTNLAFSGAHQIALFPLQKITKGNTLLDFQTIFQPSSSINPYYNTTYTVTFNKVFHKKGEIALAYLYGKSDNLNNQTVYNSLIFNRANQLSSAYHAFSSTFKKRINRSNLIVTLEPEFIVNSSEYRTNQNIEKNQAYRYLLGLKLNYKPYKKLAFYYYPKYTHFVFENSIQKDNKHNFNFLTNYFVLSSYFFDQNLKLETNFKQVNFLKNDSNFNNLNIKAVYKQKKYRFFVEFNNIFNSKNFITQELDKNIININRNRVFKRFINIGAEIKF